ncbi:protein Lilipod isoform X2 [Cylas formicarius]|uniref:protein Lilipod isoform X2 n=1 Tax=Cylas formicarius TaxID=197179 RepID=UPI00295894F3|nr:protein Lilipod isoform X2 [Cylas formicarius]
MDDYEDEPDINEQIFHNNVREQIIFLLLFLILYIASFALLNQFKKRGREDYIDEDEITVYRISTWLCTFSLTVSVGAVLLLPISIIANEVLVNYPNSYYVKWLNSSLIQGLWNYVFLFSNLSMFVLLPFAYLFTESEGFFGHRKGLWARVHETFIVLILLTIVVLGMAYVMSSLINSDHSNVYAILNVWIYLPFLYSCISFLGVLILLVCTPLGFVRLFDVVGQFLIKPQFLRDLNEEYFACALEEECLRRRLKHAQMTGKYCISPTPILSTSPLYEDDFKLPDNFLRLRNGELQTGLGGKLHEMEMRRKLLDRQRKTSSLRRNVVYPISMLLLIGLTVIAVLLVVQNTLSLLIGIKALPSSSKQFTLGVSSLSKLGPFGAALEIVIIIYFIVTSSIGLYTAPCMRNMRPTKKNTPFMLVIANCALVLIISSALPLLSKILGVTNFDLLGDFGSIEWLGNFQIVLLYNILFAFAASLCIVNKFTAKVRRELYARALKNPTNSTLCLGTVMSELRTMSYLVLNNHENIVEFVEKRKRPISRPNRNVLAKVRAVSSLVRLWYSREPEDVIISLGICSDGSFEIPRGIIFSQPAEQDATRKWRPFHNFPLMNDNTKSEINQCLNESKELLSCFEMFDKSEENWSVYSVMDNDSRDVNLNNSFSE